MMDMEKETYTVHPELIRLFHAVVPEESGGLLTFAGVNELAVKRGYIVVPEACTAAVLEWLEDERVEPNATFYKEWADIAKRSELELLFNQLAHYVTTYGSGFTMGNGYVPRGESDTPLIEYSKLVPITTVTADEMKEKCVGLLMSGIALKEETLSAVVDFIVAHGGCPADSVSNREASCRLHVAQGTHPADAAEYVRFLVYLYTGNTMLIKNSKVLNAIKDGKSPTSKDALDILLDMDDAEMKLLSTVFYRFKPVFLAMKRNARRRLDENYKVVAAKINRIRVLARKYHVPFTPGILDTLYVPGEPSKLGVISAALENVPMFRKFRMLQGITRRMRSREGDDHVYNIRNGKMFIRRGYNPVSDQLWLQSVHGAIVASISAFIHKKGNTFKVKLPKDCDLTLPTSEKNFVGEFPIGTKIRLGDHNVVGVYWRNEWGTEDFDLSMVDLEGHAISWHTGLKDEDKVMHSGDMTNADPEASECIYFAGKNSVGKVFTLNQYHGSDPEGRYRFFVGIYDGEPKLSEGYMVDPKDLVCCVDAHITSETVTLAIGCNGFLVLIGRGTGSSRITLAGKPTIRKIETLAKHHLLDVRLASLFSMCGFSVVAPDYPGNVDLDLSTMSKVELIRFFTEKPPEPKKEESDAHV